MLCAIIFLLHSTFASGQVPLNVKNIRKNLSESKADENRADLLLDLGTYYLNKTGEATHDLDSASLLKQQAAKLSATLNYPRGIGRGLLLEGQIFHERGDNKTSLVILQKAVSYGLSYHLDELVGEAYRAMTWNFDIRGEGLEKRILYNTKAAEYFQKSSAGLLQAQALESIGDLYQLKDDYKASIHALKRSLALYDSTGFKQTQGVYSLLGIVSFNDGNSYEALKYLLMAEKVAIREKDKSALVSTLYDRMGAVYGVLVKYDLSITAFEKGLKIAEDNQDADAVIQIKADMLNILRRAKKYDQALRVLKSIENPEPNSTFRIFMAFQTATLYMDLNQFAKAQPHIDSLKKFTVEFPGESQIWKYYYVAGIKYYFRTGHYKQAKTELMTADAVARLNVQKTYLVEYELYCSKVDSALGNYLSSLNYYQHYHMLSDSITATKTARQLSELQLQYDTEKKDKDIKLLTQQSQIQQTHIHNQDVMRNVIIAGLLVLLVFSGLMYNRYLLKRRANETLAVKQDEINGQNKVLHKLLNEKEWLLKEIHHRVKNNLQIVISLLNSQSAFLENEDALLAIRNSQHRMHAMSLIHQKLYQSENMASIDMHWYIHELVSYMREFFATDKRITFVLEVDQMDVDVAQAVPLGLILNEAITNAIKYAFPGDRKGRVFVSFKMEGDYCALVMEDNGVGLPVGFDPLTSESLGMSLLQGLSDQLDGNLVLKSSPGLFLKVSFKVSRQLNHI